ncbi:MAG: gamma-glutamyl-gamma-aminobutyrate hydrolase family protein [Cyanobacteriota/Melainabacteria group bacterium]
MIGINLEVDGDNPVTYEISAPYTKAILASGGIPVLIPPMDLKELQMVLSNLDGVMMIGGRDYPPKLYGKDPISRLSPCIANAPPSTRSW